MNRTTIGALALLVPMVFLSACGSDNESVTTSAPPSVSASTSKSPSASASASAAALPNITVKGAYVPAASADASTTAFAYDQKLVPAGAGAEVTLASHDGRTNVSLKATDYLPNRTYGAHLHVNPCGTDPEAAGPRFQYNVDPAATKSPSVDPRYANPQNEVWLDFTTDASGNASVTTEQPWALTADRQPHSMVVHAEKTHTGAGNVDSAGTRVSCLTLSK
jgi:Cu-Zn family superoxide dismutase